MVLQIGIVIFTWILFISSVQGLSGDGGYYDAIKKQFPYHAQIKVLDEDDSYKTTCHGAVVHANFVITSLICVQQGEVFTIEFDCIFTISHSDCKKARSLKYYIPPDAITSTSPQNYVALLKTEESILFYDYFQPARLPKAKTYTCAPSEFPCTNIFANVTGIMRGFFANWQLQWVPMKVYPISDCNGTFPADSLQYSLCARGEDRDGNKRGSCCESDPGMPLLRNNTLIGLFKETDHSDCVNGLNIFIDVQIFATWINHTLFSMRNSLSQQNATENEFPYHAHIEVYYGDKLHRNNCSGAVINSQYVISTKYCVWGGTSIRIKLGSLNPDNADDKIAYDSGTQYTGVSTYRTMEEGLALLQVETVIIFNERIQPITLPKPGETFFHHNYYFAIATGYFTGVPRHLQWAMTRVRRMVSCSELYRNVEQDVLNKSLCVHGKFGLIEDNLCNDHGVPLVVTKTETKVLVGISVGTKEKFNTCRYEGQKTLFIDVQKQIPWINTIMYGSDVEQVYEVPFTRVNSTK